jgi:hypothetical protein
VHLFPEREERGRRWLLPVALILSVVVHAAGFAGARWWWPTVARAVARALPRPTPTPEVVALSDAITIEKRTVPRESRASRPQPPPSRPSRAQPRRLAQMPQRIPVPTLAPVATAAPTVRPTTEPTTEPTVRPQRHATTHRQVAMAPARPRPTQPPVEKPVAKGAFSPEQLAAMNAQFSRTIAQSRQALTDVPVQKKPPARMPNQRRYEQVMAGTPDEVLHAQAQCTTIDTYRRGGFIYHYKRCVITYSDGYFENVTMPWPFQFTPQTDDDELSRLGIRKVFFMQAPPPGFVLPEPFALSRAVCSWYHERCQRVIDAERANGGQPATPAP